MPSQTLLHLVNRALRRIVAGEELVVLREAPGVHGWKWMFAPGREIEISTDE